MPAPSSLPVSIGRRLSIAISYVLLPSVLVSAADADACRQASLEATLYAFETSYLAPPADSQALGNVVQGYDNYLKALSATTLGPYDRKRTRAGGAHDVREDQRLFSRSSETYQRVRGGDCLPTVAPRRSLSERHLSLSSSRSATYQPLRTMSRQTSVGGCDDDATQS
jgi:hypothetical protein